MVVNQTIEMDLTRHTLPVRITAIQGEQYTRQVSLELFSDGQPWIIPEGANAVICYLRADGSGGTYDTLEDGVAAWSTQENVLTVTLTPAVLSKPGLVMLSVDLVYGIGKLSTFPVEVFVRDGMYPEEEESDYTRILGFLSAPDSAYPGQFLQVKKTDGQGNVLTTQAVTLPNVEDAVQEALTQAKESGEFDGASAYEILAANGYEGTEEEWADAMNKTLAGNLKKVNAQSVQITAKLTADAGIVINFTKNRIRGVSTPKDATDAANKQYVDQAVAPYAVPDYWQSAVDEAIAKIRAAQNAAGKDGVSFAWFSDCHIIPGATVPNPRKTGILAAAVMNACHIPYAVLCGDAARMDGDTLTSESQMQQSLEAADASLYPIGYSRLIQAQGCYDGTWGSGFGNQMDSGTLYGSVFRKQTSDRQRVFGGDGSYFYVDLPEAKLRIVVLNSAWVPDGRSSAGAALYSRMTHPGFGQEQLDWLAAKALAMPQEGWAVAVVSHIPVNAGILRDGTVLRGILAAFAGHTSYSGSSGTAGEWDYVSVSCNFASVPAGSLVGCFAGYSHKDQLIIGELPYPVITVTCDADLSEDTAEEIRTAGTATEHAMDFVTVNRKTNTVTLTRLGAGSDRSFNF